MKDWLPWLMVVLVGLLLTGGIFMLYIAYCEQWHQHIKQQIIKELREAKGEVEGVEGEDDR